MNEIELTKELSRFLKLGSDVLWLIKFSISFYFVNKVLQCIGKIIIDYVRASDIEKDNKEE